MLIIMSRLIWIYDVCSIKVFAKVLNGLIKLIQSQLAHDIVMMSMCCHHVASTSEQGHFDGQVPARTGTVQPTAS